MLFEIMFTWFLFVIFSLAAISLKSLHDQDPADSYIEAGSIVTLIYDGTNFQIQSPDANPVRRHW